jgi:3-oxoacyl-[acyl-carrier protein] reductase
LTRGNRSMPPSHRQRIADTALTRRTMDLGLRDHVAIVTGGSRGLGLATAAALASEGARLVLNGRDDGVLAEARDQLLAHGATPESIVTASGDLSDPDLARALTDLALTRFGRLDAALVSIGGPHAGPDATITDDQWRGAFDTVFLGMRRMARAAADAMTDGGSIALVLSTTVRAPLAGIATSNGLRPGLAMLAKQMAFDEAPRGVRVNCLLPGRFDTERVRTLDAASGDADAARASIESGIPLHRYGRAQEFGDVAAFVLSPRASYMTGTTITIDGGASPQL